MSDVSQEMPQEMKCKLVQDSLELMNMFVPGMLAYEKKRFEDYAYICTGLSNYYDETSMDDIATAPFISNEKYVDIIAGKVKIDVSGQTTLHDKLKRMFGHSPLPFKNRCFSTEIRMHFEMHPNYAQHKELSAENYQHDSYMRAVCFYNLPGYDPYGYAPETAKDKKLAYIKNIVINTPILPCRLSKKALNCLRKAVDDNSAEQRDDELDDILACGRHIISTRKPHTQTPLTRVCACAVTKHKHRKTFGIGPQHELFKIAVVVSAYTASHDDYSAYPLINDFIIYLQSLYELPVITDVW